MLKNLTVYIFRRKIYLLQDEKLFDMKHAIGVKLIAENINNYFINY